MSKLDIESATPSRSISILIYFLRSKIWVKVLRFILFINFVLILHFVINETLNINISLNTKKFNCRGSKTNCLKLKYQYDEKQIQAASLVYNFVLEKNSTKRIYFRNRGFWAIRKFLDDVSNSSTFSIPDCHFNCTFIKEIPGQEKITSNFSQILRTKYGIDGQIFGDDLPTFDDLLDPIPHDMWNLFFTLESPYSLQLYYRIDYRNLNFQREKNVFINYWRGADIWWPYFKWTYYDPDIKRKRSSKDYSKGKSKLAAIFISNCKSSNNRLDFVQALGRHMQVDIYGLCGDLKCEKGTEKCYEMLKRDYYFYLAFENSNCRDYITEKIYKSYLYDMVPIVLGAHPDDYRDLAPQGSYILVEDFSCPKVLAQFLIKISQNHTLYNQYFEWRETGVLVTRLEKYEDKLCYICTWLHYMDTDEGHNKPIRDLTLFQKNKNTLYEDLCLPNNQMFWTRNL